MTDLLTELEELAHELDNEAADLARAGVDPSGIRWARDHMRLIVKRHRKAQAAGTATVPADPAGS